MAEDISKFKMWEGTKGFRDEMNIKKIDKKKTMIYILKPAKKDKLKMHL